MPQARAEAKHLGQERVPISILVLKSHYRLKKEARKRAMSRKLGDFASKQLKVVCCLVNGLLPAFLKSSPSLILFFENEIAGGWELGARIVLFDP